jgi:antitoxin HicB
MKQSTYTVKLTSDKDDGGYVVTCRDLPEAITQGDTREKALTEAADCLAEANMSKFQRPIELTRAARVMSSGQVH